MNDSKKILGFVWFTGMKTIGIVLIENEMSERKSYIGEGFGMSEERDVKFIASYGSHFPIEEAMSLIEKFGTWRTIEY